MKAWMAIGILALAIASCSQPPAVSNAVRSECTSPSPSLAADLGVIAGDLSYPSEFIPPMTVFAIPVTAIIASSVRPSATCFQTVQTVLNQGTFHILDLPPGNYYLLTTWFPAVVAASDPRMVVANRPFGGAYTKAVACGLHYGCDDHSLVPVAVHAGQVTAGIGVTDWYAGPNAFPDVPGNGPQPVKLPPEPTAFSSAANAAIYKAQVATGGVYKQGACPVNRS